MSPDRNLIGRIVITPYGNGVIEDFRQIDSTFIISLTMWKLATGKNPLLYCHETGFQLKSVVINIGDTVSTQYGAGIVVNISHEGMYTIEPISWKLANNCTPKFYMLKDSLSLKNDELKVSPASSTDSVFKSAIAKANASKTEGGNFFKQKNYVLAREKYFEVLRALERVGENLSNEQRAEVLEITVPCHNNIAICCLKNKDFPECTLFARNAMQLCDALEAKVEGNSQVWECLTKRGVITDIEQLNKQWKKKALWYIANSESERKNYAEAMHFSEMGLIIVKGDPSLGKDKDQFLKMYNSSKKKNSEVLQKEKNMYRKALQLSSQSESADDQTNTYNTVQAKVTGEKKSLNKSESAAGGDEGDEDDETFGFQEWAMIGFLAATVLGELKELSSLVMLFLLIL